MKPTTQMMSKLVAVMVAVAATERAMAQQPSAPVDPKPPVERRIVVNIPAMKLELFEDGERLKVYSIAVGKRTTQTPVGSFRVATLVKKPTWYGPKKVVAAGAGNPVGTRWIGLDRKGYGIHGTNAPRSIGRAASHGCVRMRNADVEDLFARVRVGDVVEILYETVTADGAALADVYSRAAAGTAAGGGS